MDEPEPAGRPARSAIWGRALAPVLLAWGLLFPRPYDLFLLVFLLLPWLGLASVAWSWSRGRAGDRPALADAGTPLQGGAAASGPWRLAPGMASRLLPLVLLLVLPGFVLTVRALSDVQPLHAASTVLPALVATGLATAAVFLAGGMFKPTPAALLLVPLLFGQYGYGASVLLNMRLDRSPVREYLTQVERRGEASRGERTVTLAPWDRLEEPYQLAASSADWDGVRRGDTVCVAVHAGAFASAWLTARPCTRPDLATPRAPAPGRYERGEDDERGRGR